MGIGASCIRDSSHDAYIPPSGDVPHIFKAQYKIEGTLGSGSYSTVKLGVNKQTNAMVAIKIVNKENLMDVDEVALHQEVDILRTLDHQHIVKCLDFFNEDKQYYLILEYMAGGELFQRIVKRKSYNEKDARDVVKAVLLAIKYCHDRNIVHRDLKPENLLLSASDNETDLKVADFGFASTHGDMMKTQLGTPVYIAPEVLADKPYGKSVDMWSIGVISYMVLSGYPPFQDHNLRALFRKIRTCTYTFHVEHWSSISDDAKDFIRNLLLIDVTKRMTADEALQHTWLKIDDASLSKRSLDVSLVSFRNMMAKRRFRSAVLTVMAVKKMQKLAKHDDTIMVDTASSGVLGEDNGGEDNNQEMRSSRKPSMKGSSYFSLSLGRGKIQ